MGEVFHLENCQRTYRARKTHVPTPDMIISWLSRCSSVVKRAESAGRLKLNAAHSRQKRSQEADALFRWTTLKQGDKLAPNRQFRTHLTGSYDDTVSIHFLSDRDRLWNS